MKQKYYQIIKNNSDTKFILHSDNCSGDKIYYSKNTKTCYSAEQFEDSKFCERGIKAVNCYDNLRPTENENCYELASNYKIYNSIFIFNSVELRDCLYCETCWNLKNCLLCVGLKNAQYCILNTQYTKQEYFTLKEKIIQHMSSTLLLGGEEKEKEYGEFFSIKNSPFCYNETLAQTVFPLTKDEILSQSYCYKQEEKQEKSNCKTTIFPKNISTTSNNILKEILFCKRCNKSYKIIQSELNFYKKINIHVPDSCPKCRHSQRIHIMNAMKFS